MNTTALLPDERIRIIIDALTDEQVAHALRADHDLWDDDAFAAAKVLTTPEANRRLLLNRIDQAAAIGDSDDELARLQALTDAARAAHPAAGEPHFDLFEVYERQPGGLALGWYYQLAAAEPVGPYASDGLAMAAASDAGKE